MLATIADLEDPKARQEQYKAALDQALASGNVASCEEFVEHGALAASPTLAHPPPPRSPRLI